MINMAGMQAGANNLEEYQNHYTCSKLHQKLFPKNHYGIQNKKGNL